MAEYVMSEQLKQQTEEVIRWQRQQATRPRRVTSQPQLLVDRPMPVQFNTLDLVRQSGDPTTTVGEIGRKAGVPSGWNCSGRLSDSVGDLAKAGIEDLYDDAIAFEDPCLKLTKGGIWRISFTFKMGDTQAGMDEDPPTETLSTTTVDAHSHEYIRYDCKMTHAPSVVGAGNVLYQDGGEGGWAFAATKPTGFSSFTRIGYLASVSPFLADGYDSQLIDVQADTLIQLLFWGTWQDGDGDAGDSFIVSFRPTFEWICQSPS